MIIATLRRSAIAVLAVLPTACALFEGGQPANPLLGTWTTPEHDRVTFQPDTIALTPAQGATETLSAADCNGVFKLGYGSMESAPLIRLFPAQPDLAVKLKATLVQPLYPAADMTCDKGGTTYLLLDDHDLIAIYRDGGVGGMQRLTRL
jgi:hypothetical protein